MSNLDRVLIIDDDEAMRDTCARILTKLGLEVHTACDRDSATKLIDKWVFDLIVLDLVLPGKGLDLLKEVKADDPEIMVIVVSGFGTIESAVEAMKLGAYDFLSKPFSPSELRKVVNQALEKRHLALENLWLRQELENRRHRTRLIGRSPAMSQVMELVERVAPTDSTVLLTGESGTGKSLIARRIHESSSRSARPFVTVDCGTLVETLFESELFGHVKGAFTGAESSSVGKFELAHTGTIFFDEISNISLDVQAKLLKAVDDREISKVGSHRTITVDARIIAATNQDLPSAINEGRFREDLYYRLNVVSIHVPPSARTAGRPARTHRLFPQTVQRPAQHESRRPLPRSHAGPHGLRLAGQRPGTVQPHRTPGGPRPGRNCQTYRPGLRRLALGRRTGQRTQRPDPPRRRTGTHPQNAVSVRRPQSRNRPSPGHRPQNPAGEN